MCLLYKNLYKVVFPFILIMFISDFYFYLFLFSLCLNISMPKDYRWKPEVESNDSLNIASIHLSISFTADSLEGHGGAGANLSRH